MMALADVRSPGQVPLSGRMAPKAYTATALGVDGFGQCSESVTTIPLRKKLMTSNGGAAGRDQTIAAKPGDTFNEPVPPGSTSALLKWYWQR